MATNRAEVDAYKDALDAAQPGSKVALEREFSYLWGSGKANDASPRGDGAYSIFLLQLRQEKKEAETKAEAIAQVETEARNRAQRCGGGNSTKDFNSNTTKDGHQDNHNNGNEHQPPDGGLPPPGTQQNGPSQGSGVTNFMADNWMWLAGGAAVVGGGVYLYTQDRRKKSTKNYWQNDTNFLVPHGQNGNAGGGSPGGINPPANSKLILVSSASTANVGMAMNSVDVVLVDPAGAVQAVNGLTVNASCLTPNPCSLTGAKSVTMVGGRASFTGLVFNQPDRGVTLEFSAPGVQSVTSPGTFNVQGGTIRQ
jgi:hypothetical protein